MTERSPWKLDASHGVKSSLPRPSCFNQRRLPYFWALLMVSAAGTAPTNNPWQRHSCFLSCQSHLNSQSSLHSFLSARAEGRRVDSSVSHTDCRNVHLLNVERFLTVPPLRDSEVGGANRAFLPARIFLGGTEKQVARLTSEKPTQLRNP